MENKNLFIAYKKTDFFKIVEKNFRKKDLHTPKIKEFNLINDCCKKFRNSIIGFLFQALIVISFLSFIQCTPINKDNRIALNKNSLMHEIRETPHPLDKTVSDMNPPRFMWPDATIDEGVRLDGMENKLQQENIINYIIQYSKSKDFSGKIYEAKVNWAFYTPNELLDNGKWYWKYGVIENDSTKWSKTFNFIINDKTILFNPPSFKEFISKMPQYHPRLLFDKMQWDKIIKKNINNKETNLFFSRSRKAINNPLVDVSKEIDVSKVKKLKNKMKRRALLIRESRKIIDREEAYIESLIRCYVLTKKKKFMDEAIKRYMVVLSSQNSEYVAGDFNSSTMLKLSTAIYDVFYDKLNQEQRELLVNNIYKLGNKFYNEYVHHLENRLADNHVWQMTYRILTNASLAIYDKKPEALKWAEYCYNFWVSRFPGLNNDGAWHNGDSYFSVNIRTLIEIPELFGRYTNFNYFNDPWYTNNVEYLIRAQLPFSHASGQGNSHENKNKPNSSRIGYADALARELQNPWALAYVNAILKEDSNAMKPSGKTKSGDLTWYRCITFKKLPEETKTLSEMSNSITFHETGLSLFHTNIGNYKKDAMMSFRSSPYGSTSHAHANQNAFNIYYGGIPVFYSSGQRTGFVDNHSLYSYRNTRAHNSILVDGMGQKIGVEGYGWIPRYYDGNLLSYVTGDASNAYGEVTSKLWISRAEIAGSEFTPANGWDKNKVKLFRRSIVQLGKSGLYVIYDELEATENVSWQYLLHTIQSKMNYKVEGKKAEITGENIKNGTANVSLFCSEPVSISQTDKYFSEPIDWLNKHKNSPKDHRWNLTIATKKSKTVRILSIIDVHDKKDKAKIIKGSNGKYNVLSWNIDCNLKNKDNAFLYITNKNNGAKLLYDKDITKIIDFDKNKKKNSIFLTDKIPEMEI